MLHELAKCPLLEELVIDYLRDEDLNEFTRFPKLHVLTYTSKPGTKVAIQKLHDDCPHLAIHTGLNLQPFDLPPKEPDPPEP